MATPKASAKKLAAVLEYARFKLDSNKTMLELYFDIDAKTVQYAANNATSNRKKASFSGGAIIEIQIWQQDLQVYAENIQVRSPNLTDTNALDFMLSAMMRCAVPSVKSEIRLLMRQLNNTDSSVVRLRIPLDLSGVIPIDKPIISDIQMVRSATKSEDQTDPMVKSGLRLTPYPSDFYPATITSIKCYQEIYDLNRYVSDTSAAALSFRIIKLPTFEILESWGGISRVLPKPTVAIFKEIDIAELPSGHYRLQLALLSPDGKIMALRDKNFYRSNPTSDQSKTTSILAPTVVTAGTFVDTIKGRSIKQYVYHLKAIASRAEAGTIDILIQGSDYASMRSFYLEFWQRRDKAQAYDLHADYRAQVIEAQNRFGSRSKPLLESDRARVFLRYGLPNQMLNEQTDNNRQANANPNMTYEIWQYYSLEKTKQSSVEFVFIRDLSSSQFVLVHSNATGERRSDNWRSGQFSTIR